MDFSRINELARQWLETLEQWLRSPQFYAQLGLIAATVLLAYLAAGLIRRAVPLLREPPKPGVFKAIRNVLYQFGGLLFPLLLIAALGISARISTDLVAQDWLIKIAQSLATVFLIYSIIRRYVTNPVAASITKWIAIPVATLHVFGWLDDVTTYLDSLSIELGNIHLSVYGVARALIFGSLLFWLGRVSNNTGQQIIRKQEALDVGTREVMAKLFQVLVAVAIMLVLLQVMGINLTTLAVFGGAVGVGLGFGLQSIASNFISGIIILLDRSVTVGDYVELEDGRAGIIREMNMRSTTLETFDGKDIVVPNEKFITGEFINWTHKDPQQRYSINLSVAYSTDLHALFTLLRETVASHPQVLSGPQFPLEMQPDAEISGFGDSGIDILIEYWMNGIDDGPNRVGADLLLMIWDAFRQHGIEIPFPQREVRMLNPS
ncbi:MAG: mechanosensitive ion channel [Gammaproteobacteria bacterium]|nr:mechanosensitive ion channel [Gammaproteobacteria bacterium]